MVYIGKLPVFFIGVMSLPNNYCLLSTQVSLELSCNYLVFKDTHSGGGREGAIWERKLMALLFPSKKKLYQILGLFTRYWGCLPEVVLMGLVVSVCTLLVTLSV